MSTKTFTMGGVHPPDSKITSSKKIEELKVPSSVYIPVSQHIGAPAELVVEKGQEVKEGDLIAKGVSGLSANIHASVSGTVGSIKVLPQSNGFKGLQIEIIADENSKDKKVWNADEDIIADITLDSEAIIEKIYKAGIVGMGGATFPTHFKLKIPKGKKADILLINGAECEPYLTADHLLMLEKPKEIIVGIRILMKALNVNKAIIGIENNKKDAVEQFQELIDSSEINTEGIQVQAMKVKYPQGGEKQLIKTLIDREVPSGELPISVGTVVQNVATAFAVYEAVQKDIPLYKRVLTLTGNGIKNPANYLVRIGTPLSAVLEAGGGVEENASLKIISGGPMMGKAVNDISSVVEKGTSGILVLSGEGVERPKVQNCIRCGRCSSACCIGLEPHLLIKLSERDLFDRCEEERIMDCIECGSCSFICPSGLPLLDYIRLAKRSIIEKRRKKS